MTDRNRPEVIYPGSELWPEDAPRWATHATTFFIDNEFETFDLIFTRTWSTPVPHHPDDAEPDPFEHFTVTLGWTRTHEGPWYKLPPRLEFAGPEAPKGEPREVAAILREVADVLDGSAD